MPRFSEFFSLDRAQAELDFVDVSNEYDTNVYVDPYAIEVNDDIWADETTNHIRSFFNEVLQAIRDGNLTRATTLMSHLREPKETFLGISLAEPKGRGVGAGQSQQLITAIARSRAYETGLLTDLSEMSLYVEGIDRDKISDLTTNVIRALLVEYTQQQCEIFGIETENYSGPPLWNVNKSNWISKIVQLPYINDDPILLVPKYIVRRKLSLDSQEFYNKQITDYLISEHIRANDSLVHVIKGVPKVYKGEVREKHPKSKSLIAEMVLQNPNLLKIYKNIARKYGALINFDEESPSINSVCLSLSEIFSKIESGGDSADDYHGLVMSSMTALFYPDLIQPRKEWEIDDGRKRVDIVFTNAANSGFFAQRRSDKMVNANVVIVECKNYSSDIANPEFDQLLGRFDENKGKFGIITCRSIDDVKTLNQRCRDASTKSRGYIIVLTDQEIVSMLVAKSKMNDNFVSNLLFSKYRELLS